MSGLTVPNRQTAINESLMKALLLLVLLALPNFLLGQANLAKQQSELIGSEIDEIELTDYLQNQPVDKDFNGKFKVLEFWASWCKPCLKAVPHMNRLQRKFKDQNIVFLSVTYQKPEETEKVLEKVNFETIVVSDQTRTLHKNLKIEVDGFMAIPRTVLIDNKNKIIWYGSPKDLTGGLIEKFLKKESL